MALRLRGPQAVLGTPDYGAYVAKFTQFCAQRGFQPTRRIETIAMYVNDGRWIGDCPHCASGMHAEPGWLDIRCLGCGRFYNNVTWPTDLTAIEDELLVRPIRNQNANVGETVDGLSRENLDRGLPSPHVDRKGP